MNIEKVYEITTIAEIEQIPEDRLDEFFADLKSWLGLRQAEKEINKMLITLAPGGAIKGPDHITWVDDGTREIRIPVLTSPLQAHPYRWCSQSRISMRLDACLIPFISGCIG